MRRNRFGRPILAAVGLATIVAVPAVTSTLIADPPPAHRARTFAPPPANATFGTPQYFGNVSDDTYYNTVGPTGDILTTANDSTGVNRSCGQGKDLVILRMTGADPRHLAAYTVNCMPSYGPRGGGTSPDGCSWKTGGMTRIGPVVYLVVARQIRQCNYGKEANGLQPSFNASIIKSVDGGRTWTNPFGTTSADGAAPAWSTRLHRYRAMFPGRQFSAPFFIQYGPGNTHTVDGANKYLYAVSNDGYAYNGNYLHLARVPLNKVQTASAWQFYHGSVGGAVQKWTRSIRGATRVLQVKNGVSQPAIQYVPSLRRYVLMTFTFSRGRSDFPVPSETPYTRYRFYTAPKPWGPWTKVYDHTGQRSLWCASDPCGLIRQPGSSPLTVGSPNDWVGLYDESLVQKFVYTRPLSDQALLTTGDWKNQTRWYPPQRLNRLLVLPINLAAVLKR